jgi:hypothetical protein
MRTPALGAYFLSQPHNSSSPLPDEMRNSWEEQASSDLDCDNPAVRLTKAALRRLLGIIDSAQKKSLDSRWWWRLFP